MTDAPGIDATEVVELWRPSDVPGVEAMHVRNSTRLWRRFHDTYTACSNLHVAADMRYRGRIDEITGGSTVFFEAGEVHVNTRVRVAQSFEVLFVDPGVLTAAAAELSTPGAQPHWREVTSDDPATFAELAGLHRALADAAATPLERQSRLAACLRALLVRHGERRARDRAPVACHAAVRRAREYLAAHYAEEVTLDALARAAYLSKYHLVRVFCAEVGLPPHAYLTELRVAAARRLIAAGCAVSDAAYHVGFAAQTHLHRHFVRGCGVTPGRYARATAVRRAHR